MMFQSGVRRRIPGRVFFCLTYQIPGIVNPCYVRGAFAWEKRQEVYNPFMSPWKNSRRSFRS